LAHGKTGKIPEVAKLLGFFIAKMADMTRSRVTKYPILKNALPKWE
jgi:hypothetical protein